MELHQYHDVARRGTVERLMQRRTWPFPPITKTVESGKKYRRNREKHDLRMKESCFFAITFWQITVTGCEHYFKNHHMVSVPLPTSVQPFC